MRALFKILILTASFFSNCFVISSSNSCETPFLPTHIVGCSLLNLRLMRRRIPIVNLLISFACPPFSSAVFESVYRI
jgi:hypothetical protein